ncbi:MAG: hypothetical protein L0220_28950, partial [Acidobacteria bacterium]|nr:hypothetical protein [Acidobacteriota bacterium]
YKTNENNWNALVSSAWLPGTNIDRSNAITKQTKITGTRSSRAHGFQVQTLIDLSSFLPENLIPNTPAFQKRIIVKVFLTRNRIQHILSVTVGTC